jgi:hypothetical protein
VAAPSTDDLDFIQNVESFHAFEFGLMPDGDTSERHDAGAQLTFLRLARAFKSE